MTLAGMEVVEGEPWTLEHLFYGARAEDEMPVVDDVRRLLHEYYEMWCMKDVTPQTVVSRIFEIMRIPDDRPGLTWTDIHDQFLQDFIRWRKLDRWATAHDIHTEGDVRDQLRDIQQVYKMVRQFLIANNTICARMRNGIPGAADVLPDEERNNVIQDKKNNSFEKRVLDIVKTSIETPRLGTTSETPTAVHERWRAMMKEGTFGDVGIVCADGEEIKAHTCVLAHSSDYFRRLFEGPWNKETVHVDVPAEAMHGLLSYLYLGEIDTDVIARHTTEFLCLSQQYFLPDLMAMVDAQLARDVDINRLTELLILSDKYGAMRLMRACLDLVCSNKATAFSRLIDLHTTHPDLWNKVVEVASADEPVNKTTRTTSKKKRTA
jgi:hypothetical protein